jgi:hypothetical protein
MGHIFHGGISLGSERRQRLWGEANSCIERANSSDENKLRTLGSLARVSPFFLAVSDKLLSQPA